MLRTSPLRLIWQRLRGAEHPQGVRDGLPAVQSMVRGQGRFLFAGEPETVAAFLAAETGNGTKPSTLARRVAAIRYAHKLAQLDTPTDPEAVKATL